MAARGGKAAPDGGEAYLLAGIGGCIDAIGLLTLGGLFVSHMSGNTAALGAAFGQGDWKLGLPHLFAVPVFVAGLFLGYSWMQTPTYRRCAWILLAEAAFLAAFLTLLVIFGEPVRATPGYFFLAALPLLAMGMQNATLRQIGRSMFPSTYVTGVLDSFAKFTAQAVFHKARGGEEAVLARRLAGIWFSYVAGALLGSAGLLWLRFGILAAPIAVLMGLALRFFLAAEVKAPPPGAPAS